MTEVVAALVWEGEKFMICQRPAHKARGLLWEFVGGKVEPGETKEQALIRECRDELAVTLSVGDVFMDVIYEYSDITVHLTLFNATKVSDLKDATVGVMVGTLAYDYAKVNIKDDIQTFNDDAALAQALDAGQIDALVTSTVECVYMVQSEQVKDAKVLGRLPDSEDKSGMGIVLPKDSKLTAAVTKAVDDLNADSTIKKLQDKWLAEYTTDLTELKK